MKNFKFFTMVLLGILAINLTAAITITNIEITDSLGNVRQRFSSSEKIGIKLTASNDQQTENINFYFYIYDPNNTQVFIHKGNSATGNIGTVYSEIGNVPINFYTQPGKYKVEGKVVAGGSEVTSSKEIEIYSPQITLSYPPNGVRNLPDKPIIFRWVSSGSSKYKVYVADECGFTEPVIWTAETVLTFIEYTGPGLSAGTIYWWKVEGLDANNNLVASCRLPYNFTVKTEGDPGEVRDLATTDISLLPSSKQFAVKIKVQVENLGSQPESNVPVNLFVEGVQIMTDKRVSIINSGEVKNIIFEFVPLNYGMNRVAASVLLHDDKPENNIIEKTLDFSYDAEENAAVSGQVTDEYGKEVYGAWVHYIGAVTGKVLTEQNGQYKVDGLPVEIGSMQYEFYASKAGYDDSIKIVKKIKKGTEHKDVNFILQNEIDSRFVLIEGIVKDSINNEFIRFAEIRYVGPSKQIETTKTGPGGEYKIEKVPPGKYYLTCSHKDYLTSDKEKVKALKRGQRYALNFILKDPPPSGKEASIYGTVRNLSDGVILEGERVS